VVFPSETHEPFVRKRRDVMATYRARRADARAAEANKPGID
jgi:hypothetical protein